MAATMMSARLKRAAHQKSAALHDFVEARDLRVKRRLGLGDVVVVAHVRIVNALLQNRIGEREEKFLWAGIPWVKQCFIDA